MPEAGTVAPIRAMLLDLPRLERGSQQGLAIGVDPAKQAKVDGTEFAGHQPVDGATPGSRAAGCFSAARTPSVPAWSVATRLRSSGRPGQRRAEVVGVMDAVGPMGGMEMRLSLDTMKRVYGHSQPAELARRGARPRTCVGDSRRRSQGCSTASIRTSRRSRPPRRRTRSVMRSTARSTCSTRS